MKKTLFTLSLAAAGLVAAPAFAQSHDGFFINGSVGQAKYDRGLYDDDDTAWNANFGYRWAVSPSVLFGVEGGYAHLGSFKYDRRFNPVTRADARLKGWTAGVNMHANLTPNWYLSGRAGLFRGDVRGGWASAPVGDVDVPTFHYVDETSNKWYAGAGFGYDFSNNFSLGLNYDYYRAEKHGLRIDPDVWSVSAEFRF